MTQRRINTVAQLRNLILTVAACLITALGLTIMVGWHTGIDGLIQWAPGLRPTVYKTALCFVALGAAFLLVRPRAGRVVLVPTALVGGISVLTLGEYLTGKSLGLLEWHANHWSGALQPGPMAPNTAVCMLLVSIAILLISRDVRSERRMAMISLAASAAFGISAIAFVGYVTGAETFGWGPFVPMAAPTSVGLILSAACVFILIWGRGASNSHIPSWLYLAVSTATLIMTISLWQTLSANERSQVEIAVQKQMDRVKHVIASEMRSRIAGMERSARRWERRGAPEQQIWEFETRLLLRDLGGYRAMAWVDPTLHVRWVYPAEGNEGFMGADLGLDPVHRQLLEFVRSQKRPRVTHALNLIGGGRGINVYVPIFRGEKFEGITAGRFEFKDLFSAMLPPSARGSYAVAVLDGQERLYGDQAPAERRWVRQGEIEVENVRWTVKVWPTDQELAVLKSQASEVVLVAGVVLSILFGIVVYLAQVAWLRARAAETARRDLETEIAERSRAEQELEEFFTVSPEMLCIAGLDGYFKRLNPAWMTLGYPMERLLSEPFEEFIHPDDRHSTKDALDKQGSGESILAFENRYRAHDGTYRWLRWNSRPNGQRQLVFAAARDVTAQKAAEEQLRQARDELERRVQERTAELAAANESLHESEALFRKLFEDAPIGAALIGADHRFANVNKALCEWLGYDTSELSSFKPEDIAFDEDAAAVKRMLDQVICSQAAGFRHVSRYVAKSGEIVWGHLTTTTIQGVGDQALTVLAMMENITERIHRDLEISRLNAELEAKVAELTTVNEELESFNYSVSHDLRAPLRHIDGYTNILLAEHSASATEDALRCMERIRDGARRMGRMVDELLELSRTSRRGLLKQITGLGALVKDVIEDLQPEVQGRKVEWMVGDLPFVDCDPSLTRQVFVNLLSNALKYSGPRNPAVIEVGQTAFDGQTAIFVRDNGVGFNMKYADKLFGVFQRLHRREDFEGTGIGLAMVKRIIQKHGGRIWAEAALEKGATFYFTLEASRHGAAEEVPLEASTTGGKQC